MTPKWVLGTAQFGMSYGIHNLSGQPSKQEVFRILDVAAHAQIPTLDTAAAYGAAEEIIGEYHRDHPPFQVNTKIVLQSFTDLEKAVSGALERLNVEMLHVLFLHRFADYHGVPGLADELANLKTKGRVRFTGVSVYTNEEAKAAAHLADIDVVQLPFNLLDNEQQRGDVIEILRRNGKQVQARSVFLQGLFFMNQDEIPARLLHLAPYLERIRSLAAAAEAPLETLALHYVLSKSSIDQAVVGVDHAAHLQRNLAQTKGIPPSVLAEVDQLRVAEPELLNPVNWK